MTAIQLPAELTAKVLDRVNEMKNDPMVQSIMMQFENDNDAIDWLYKAAIATLFGIN